MLVYCDAKVFIDKVHDRSDSIRPLKTLAEEFFSKGWNCTYELIISDWLETELSSHLDQDEIDAILDPFRSEGKLYRVEKSAEDEERAEEFSNPDDALHAVLAEKSGAKYLVTRNARDYTDYDGIDVVLPEFIR